MLNVKTAHHFHTKLRKELGDIYRLQLHYNTHTHTQGVMQGKLIAVVYTLRTH